MSTGVEAMLPHSYRNFHAKGFDYLCLQRTPSLTVKAYFFDGDLAHQPELVMPHNHRYPFTTQVIAGNVDHVRFDRSIGEPYLRSFSRWRYANQFNYMTPLNGGSGFVYDQCVYLCADREDRYARGDTYYCSSRDIHTLRILSEGTVMVLVQLADDVPPDRPTQAFSFTDKESPSLAGLYDPMDADRAVELLERLTQLGWQSFNPHSGLAPRS